MTTRSIFWRLFWKEYRLQRALWIAMAVLTALLLWNPVGSALDSMTWCLTLFRIAVALPAFYALGCGAVLFAGEQEADTYEFQRALPVSARRVFWGKIAFALISTAAMFALMWLLAAFLSGWRLLDAHEYVLAWGTLGFFGLEMFLWATLFSLLSKRVLVSAILGIMAASISVRIMTVRLTTQIVMETYVAAMPSTTQIVMETYVAAMPWRAAVAALVALADFWLGARWFNERRERPGWGGSCTAAPLGRCGSTTAAPTSAAAFSDRYRTPQRTAILSRLIWQHWRQSIGLMIALVPVIVLLAAFPAGKLLVNTWQFGFHSLGDVNHRPLYVLALAMVPLLAACAFMPDQWGRGFRYLTDRGVPPKYVWLSRQLVALVPIGLLLPVLLYFAFFLASEQWVPVMNEMVRHPRIALTYVSGCVVIGFAVGQFCSMFFRSSIL